MALLYNPSANITPAPSPKDVFSSFDIDLSALATYTSPLTAIAAPTRGCFSSPNASAALTARAANVSAFSTSPSAAYACARANAQSACKSSAIILDAIAPGCSLSATSLAYSAARSYSSNARSLDPLGVNLSTCPSAFIALAIAHPCGASFASRNSSDDIPLSAISHVSAASNASLARLRVSAASVSAPAAAHRPPAAPPAPRRAPSTTSAHVASFASSRASRSVHIASAEAPSSGAPLSRAASRASRAASRAVPRSPRSRARCAHAVRARAIALDVAGSSPRRLSATLACSSTPRASPRAPTRHRARAYSIIDFASSSAVSAGARDASARRARSSG
mmetsp:Transcript_7219/g.29109  ORF Transcript_7219/g.29109 Transcript_7219/m.29109 type:complete len:337 (+) Transcript_7219:1522-2532(+)